MTCEVIKQGGSGKSSGEQQKRVAPPEDRKDTKQYMSYNRSKAFCNVKYQETDLFIHTGDRERADPTLICLASYDPYNLLS